MAREPTRSTEIFATLCTALDDVEIGIALLDKELRLQFINRTFPRLWRVANDEVVDAPDFESLMRIVAHRLSPMPQAEADKIVSERIRLVRAGLEGPRDVRLADGQVIRVRCKPLPNGGRMLIYSDVTDLVEQADQLRQFATLDSLTGLFNRRHFLILAEIEWARYRRYQRPTSMLMIDVDRFKVINDGLVTTLVIMSSRASRISAANKSACRMLQLDWWRRVHHLAVRDEIG